MHNRANVKKYKYWIWGVTASWLVFDLVWNMAMVPRSSEGSAESYLAIVLVPIVWWIELVMFRILHCFYMFRPARLSIRMLQIICVYFYGFFALLMVVLKFVSIAGTIVNNIAEDTFPYAHNFIIVAGASYFALLNHSRQAEMR